MRKPQFPMALHTPSQQSESVAHCGTFPKPHPQSCGSQLAGSPLQSAATHARAQLGQASGASVSGHVASMRACASGRRASAARRSPALPSPRASGRAHSHADASARRPRSATAPWSPSSPHTCAGRHCMPDGQLAVELHGTPARFARHPATSAASPARNGMTTCRQMVRTNVEPMRQKVCAAGQFVNPFWRQIGLTMDAGAPTLPPWRDIRNGGPTTIGRSSARAVSTCGSRSQKPNASSALRKRRGSRSLGGPCARSSRRRKGSQTNRRPSPPAGAFKKVAR